MDLRHLKGKRSNSSNLRPADVSVFEAPAGNLFYKWFLYLFTFQIYPWSDKWFWWFQLLLCADLQTSPLAQEIITFISTISWGYIDQTVNRLVMEIVVRSVNNENNNLFASFHCSMISALHNLEAIQPNVCLNHCDHLQGHWSSSADSNLNKYRRKRQFWAMCLYSDLIQHPILNNILKHALKCQVLL